MSARVRGVQTFPWQDPWDPAEGRVQPVKERLRARQSISSLHLHNKWRRMRAHTHTHTYITPECIHSALISTRRRKVREMGREEEKERRRGQLSAGVALYKYKLIGCIRNTSRGALRPKQQNLCC